MGVSSFLQILLVECEMASQSAGNPSQKLHHLNDHPNHGDVGLVDGMDVEVVAAAEAEPDPGQATVSPLTFGKVFGAIPRVTAVNTPNINNRIAQRWGLPAVDSSEEFRKIYSEGRATMR